MSEATPSDPNERSFSDLVRRGVRDLREQRGPCPSSEELVAFYEGRLPADAAARVRDHVEACGLCDVQLGRLERAAEPPRRALPEAIWVFLRKPVVPYALVALLSFPAYRGLVHRAKDVEKRPDPAATQRPDSAFGVAPIPSFSLDTVRSDSQVQKSSLIRLSGDERFFLLSFFVPIKASPTYHYEVVVVRGDETAVVPAQALRDCDGAGNCFLLCNPALFSPGRYQLRVTETGPAGSKIVPPFPFEIGR